MTTPLSVFCFHIAFLVLFFYGFGSPLQAQRSPKKEAADERIYINNGSYEGVPQDAATVEYWDNCGYNSTPDLLPGPWGVNQKPAHGDTYLGLTTREDNTFEGIYTELTKPLKKGHCYSFKIDLAHSQTYAGYSGAVSLRIWGGNKNCEKKQLLVCSPVVGHADWRSYNFSFYTNESYSFIIIEAYYKTPSLLPYRGNILIDAFFFFDSCERA